MRGRAYGARCVFGCAERKCYLQIAHKNLHFNVLIQILFIPVQSGGAKLVPGTWQSPGGAAGGIWEQRQSLHLGIFTLLVHTAAITRPPILPLFGGILLSALNTSPSC